MILIFQMFNLFIFLLITGCSLDASNLSSQYGARALNALQHLLNFFESDASNLNLDGLYGLRIAQGQLIALSEQTDILDQNSIISSLIKQIERIANVTLKQLEQEATAYLHRFSLVARQPFIIQYQPKKIQRHLINNQERSNEFNEEKSDQCFAELLGNSPHLNLSDHPSSILGSSDRVKCSTSQSCWDMMTSLQTKDYRLTHQLLWFLIGKTIGCIQSNLHPFEDYFCANIYHDAHENLKYNINQDLFLEQLLLCSIIGYKDFLRLDWFETILTWQDSQYGCFSDQSETIRFHRHLLFEQEMNHGCLAHKSGLAAGLLGTYTRIFLQ